MLVAAARIRGLVDLRWFFHEGETTFHRSPSGAILERQDRYTHSFSHVKDNGEIVSTRIRGRRSAQMMRVRAGGGGDTRSAPRDEDLDRYSVVSRLLDAVCSIDPTLAAAIRAPFSVAGATFGWLGAAGGARCSSSHLVLYALVPSGKALIRLATGALERQNAKPPPKGRRVTARAARRAAKRAGRAQATVMQQTAADRPSTVPWLYVASDGTTQETTRPRVVTALADHDLASARPGSVQLADEMLRPGGARAALQPAAELESIALLDRAIDEWNAACDRLGYYPPGENGARRAPRVAGAQARG